MVHQSNPDPRRAAPAAATTTRSRHRSSSDPFSDPRVAHRVPDPPPKLYSMMPAAATAARPRDNIVDAVRDTVTREQIPRKVPARSYTAVPPSVVLLLTRCHLTTPQSTRCPEDASCCETTFPLSRFCDSCRKRCRACKDQVRSPQKGVPTL
jgi:hypothetical protein